MLARLRPLLKFFRVFKPCAAKELSRSGPEESKEEHVNWNCILLAQIGGVIVVGNPDAPSKRAPSTRAIDAFENTFGDKVEQLSMGWYNGYRKLKA